MSLREVLQRFQHDHELIVPDKVLLMRNIFMPGLIIADVLAKRFGSNQIIYSDSGVREGYIYAKILNDEDF